MKVKVKRGRIDQTGDQAITLAHFEDQRKLTGMVKAIDERLSGMISHLLKNKDFVGRLNQTAIIYPQSKPPNPRIILVGLGKSAEFDWNGQRGACLEKLRQAFASACRRAKELRIKSFSTMVFPADLKGMDLAKVSQAMAEGILLSNYQMDQYKTTKEEESLESFTIVEEDREKIEAIEKGAALGEVFAEATNFARGLANQPSNILTPARLSLEAKKLAKEDNLRCEILSLPQIKRLKMNSFLAVASGSKEPPKLIILEYRPDERLAKKKKYDTLVLVGKGITFDAGGLSLKTTEEMLEMKGDMTGGAVVMSTIAGSAKLKLPLNLIGIIPAAENLPSGSALKIGDIITSYSGKTIEILNTDAEGRLILADALSYAKVFKPDAILDIATLTSAIKIALGTVCAGVFGNHEKLKSKMIQAGQKTGERVWELPLWDDYQEFIKSDLADIKNVGGKPGAAIIAARFLQNFVGNYPWVHVDIAGVDFSEKERPYIPKGAIGFGARLLLQFLRDWDGV
ncbi:MAG: leucyl aminopeptidase [candidate division Zixibacteria bacterium]|nr:leucyl aminopeptidase [candidate division Zixibacteria bacterium]